MPILLVLQASAKKADAPGLTEEEIEEIREAFNLFDTDGSGACVQSKRVRSTLGPSSVGETSLVERRLAMLLDASPMPPRRYHRPA